MSIKDIAIAMEKTTAAVACLLKRGTAKLRDTLERYGEFLFVNQEESDGDLRQIRIDTAISEYLGAIDRNPVFDHQTWLARYTDVRADLEAFLHDNRQLELVFGSDAPRPFDATRHKRLSIGNETHRTAPFKLVWHEPRSTILRRRGFIVTFLLAGCLREQKQRPVSFSQDPLQQQDLDPVANRID